MEKKNNQVSIHNPFSPFTVPTYIKLRPLSKVYVSVQQDFLMTMYKKEKKNILYTEHNNNNSNSHNTNDNIIIIKNIGIKRRRHGCIYCCTLI